MLYVNVCLCLFLLCLIASGGNVCWDSGLSLCTDPLSPVECRYSLVKQLPYVVDEACTSKLKASPAHLCSPDISTFCGQDKLNSVLACLISNEKKLAPTCRVAIESSTCFTRNTDVCFVTSFEFVGLSAPGAYSDSTHQQYKKISASSTVAFLSGAGLIAGFLIIFMQVFRRHLLSQKWTQIIAEDLDEEDTELSNIAVECEVDEEVVDE